jgi:HEAT repeat protein
MAECKDILLGLTSEDTSLIRDAAYEAGASQCEDAVPRLADLLKSQHLGVQEAADQALRKIGGPRVVRAMIPFLRSDNPPQRNLGMDILRAVGDQELPALVELIRDPDPDVRIFITDILGSTDSVMSVKPLCDALLKDPEVNVRYQAAVSLGNLARPEAAKCLNKAMEDEEWVQYAVIEALSKIRHSSSVGALVKALDHTSDLVGSMIIDALGEMGNVQAVTMLLKRMDDAPTAMRNKIVKAIVNILGGKSLTLLSKHQRERFRDYLLVALDDEEQDIQDAAIQGLAFVGGEQASGKVLELAASIDSDHEPERLEQTIQALAQMGLTQALDQGLHSENQAMAQAAVNALGRIKDPAAAKSLSEAFWEKDRDLQRTMVASLSAMAGKEAKDLFLDILERHEDGDVIKEALRFLGQKLKLQEAAEQVFAMLDHPYDDVKETALDACIAIGGEKLKEWFRALLNEDDPLKRLMGVYALGEMGGQEDLDRLHSALEDEIPDVRKVALEAITHLCADNERWLDMVRSRLHDESKEVRLTLAEALGKRFDESLIPYLVEALDDEDPWVTIRAVEALGDHQVRQAANRLVELLVSSNKLIVLKAMKALGAIGGAAAFRSLLELSSSDDPELAQAAEEAITHIQDNEGDTD